MAELVDEGKVRWIGVCNHDSEQLERCEAVRHVDSLQPELSLLARGARSELLPWADGHGTGVIAYSPMASGMLTGAFDHGRVEQLDPGDWRAGRPIPGTRASGEPRARRRAPVACRACEHDGAVSRRRWGWRSRG